MTPVTRFVLIFSLLICILAPSLASASEATRYVTDQLEITMRSGQSTKHQIIRMLASGQPVEVIEVDEENKYSRVRTQAGEDGWVLTRYLDDVPSGLERLRQSSQQLEQQTEKKQQLLQTVTRLRADIKKLESELNTANQQNKQYEQDLNHIKRVSANTLTIDTENQSLKAQVKQLEADYATSQQQVAALQNNAERDWFMLGAGVILLGMLIGLIIPRIRWRKKSDWGAL